MGGESGPGVGSNGSQAGDLLQQWKKKEFEINNLEFSKRKLICDAIESKLAKFNLEGVVTEQHQDHLMMHHMPFPFFETYYYLGGFYKVITKMVGVFSLVREMKHEEVVEMFKDEALVTAIQKAIGG